MLSGNYWPAHPQPLPDELLSSWLVRIAHANGLKLQTFCDQVFGKERQLWNRDIDRLAPDWLIRKLHAHTGASLQAARHTTLSAYRGRLFRQRQLSGQLRWILPLRVFHRKRLGFGVQFCPKCLAEDAEPYFRRRWRVAFYTFCPRHDVLLGDRCPRCGAPVAFHRRELGHPQTTDSGPMALCHACDYDLRQAPATPVPSYEASAFELMKNMLATTEFRPDGERRRFGLGFYDVLHQLCKLVVSARKALRLKEFVLARIGAADVPLARGRFPFEVRPVGERHHVLLLTLWLMADLDNRLTKAWNAKAVRYNMLVKDFGEPPRWFLKVVARFNRGDRMFATRLF